MLPVERREGDGGIPDRAWLVVGVVDEPTYQVVFWRKHNDPEPLLRPLWGSEPHRLREVVDVNDVLAWAETHADGRLVAVYAEVPDKGLVLLRGRDPTWDG